MNDVAALAGVSLKTVSRVVNGETTVNPELAKRVHVAAEELRFQPNFGASALRRNDHRSSTIAVLLQDLSNPLAATMLRAIEEVAGARNVSVLSGSLDESPEREHELTTSMSRHGVDGVIIAPASHEHHYLATEQQAGVPYVFIDRPPQNLLADQVLSDSRSGAADAVRHLIKHGHQRIGFLGDSSSLFVAHERHLGYTHALTTAGLSIDPTIVARDLRTIDRAQESVSEMLASQNPPTAFFASQNLLTIGAVQALRLAASHFQVGLIGFEDFLLADLLDPAVSVVTYDVSAMASLAAQLLFDRIDGSRPAPRHFVIPTTLISRGSGEIRP
ncbi:MAG: LacI family DNA-binding transcriptional regulator [Acidimicrobiales bacterium]|jgi:LacI family transcriptional regulator